MVYSITTATYTASSPIFYGHFIDYAYYDSKFGPIVLPGIGNALCRAASYYSNTVSWINTVEWGQSIPFFMY